MGYKSFDANDNGHMLNKHDYLYTLRITLNCFFLGIEIITQYFSAFWIVSTMYFMSSFDNGFQILSNIIFVYIF